MNKNRIRFLGVISFTLLFPVTAPVMQYIPNPMVPGAIVSLNMILPILAGYFFGPLSGLVAGAVGVWLTALFQVDQFYLSGVFTLGLIGMLAGLIGRNHRAEISTAVTIILAHIINILVLIRMGMLSIPADRLGVTILGLSSEAAIDIIAILLLIFTLKRWLYQTERW